MVVHFAQDVPSVSSSSDERHPVKKKYLVSRNRERKSSIFDYVHLSSSLVRKVRYGQSLDAALVARSPWGGSAPSPGAFRGTRDSPVARSSVSIWRDDSDAPETPARQNEHSKTSRRVAKGLVGDGAIRYGRQVQLQATDGGFLALDADGCLVKLPSSHREDPSTLLTLFPQDPFRAPGSKLPVRTGELCFVVVGAATVTTDHDVLYADSRRMVDPPAALRNAVILHQRQHRGGRAASQSDLTAARSRGDGKRSTIWSFRSTTVKPSRDVLDNGMLVQLSQQDLTMHYETEQIVKKKYKPITSSGPEVENPPSPVEIAHNDSAPTTGIDASGQSIASQSPAFTHVWLQRNDISSQHDTRASKLISLKPKQWDNLWFIIDVTTDRKREQEQKQREAVLEAERDADLRYSDDSDDRNEHDHNRDSTMHRRRQDRKVGTTTKRVERETNEKVGNNNNDEGDESSNKRMSVLNARLFVSAEAEEAQRHAAAIIVRFMRRVFRREAERRAKDLIDRRIRRTGKHHRHGDVDECTFSTMQQLRVLQCFKPNVYGSQRVLEPMGAHAGRIPGIPLQGSKYPRQEAQRLASMQRDLSYLGSDDFKKQHVVVQRSTWRPVTNQYAGESSHGLDLRVKHEKLSRDRDREHKYHVQLAMAHREKPPFRFGKMDIRLHAHQRPQTAPASPLPKP